MTMLHTCWLVLSNYNGYDREHPSPLQKQKPQHRHRITVT